MINVGHMDLERPPPLKVHYVINDYMHPLINISTMEIFVVDPILAWDLEITLHESSFNSEVKQSCNMLPTV